MRDRDGRIISVPSLALDNPRVAAQIIAPLLADQPVEIFAVACLSARNRILAWHIVSRGTRASTLVSIPDVFVPACITPGTVSLLVVHNHPSPDERYASVQALYEAAAARRLNTYECTIDTSDFRTEAVENDVLAKYETSGHTAALTHWSFGQLATIAGAPPNYLRSLPASIASKAINYGLQRHGREQHQLLADRAAPWTVHAITSPRYARVHHDELARRVLDLTAQHPAWHLPLGYKDSEFGAERVPTGAYLGDRDMFLFLVDGNRDLDDPTDRTDAGLFRGFILRNSDVGAAALSGDAAAAAVPCSTSEAGSRVRGPTRRPHHG